MQLLQFLQFIHAQKLVKYNILAYFKKQGFRIRDEPHGIVGFFVVVENP